MPTLLRCSSALLLGAATALAAIDAEASPPLEVRVRGSSHLEARLVRSADDLRLVGVLRDDASAPIADANVEVSLAGTATTNPSGMTATCPGMPRARRSDSGWQASTDSEGNFCLRVDPSLVGNTLSLRFPGSLYHDTSPELALPVDISRRSVSLRFTPQPRYLSLDRPHHVLQVAAEVTDSSSDETPLPIVVFIAERQAPSQELGRCSVAPGRRCRIDVPSERIGGPGPATLSARFDGSTAYASSEHYTVVERTVSVQLSLAREPQPADPSDGIPLTVAVGCRLGAVPSGSIEALRAGESVGTAPVNAGSARLVATFDPPPGEQAELSIRYLPDAPWYRAEPPISVQVPLARSSGWSFWPWALAVAGIGAWVLRGWRRPARRAHPTQTLEAAPPSGRASVELVVPGTADAGWEGDVVDAHDGSPVANAEVRVEQPSFAEAARPEGVRTDEAGHFSLPPLPGNKEGARLRVTALWHASLHKRLPPPGRLHISLVTRRRALLERLVKWADRMGYPWRKQGEATPGDVKRTADKQGMEEIAEWAGSVEVAAFGPDPVDAEREGAVKQREPHWKGHEETSR